MMIVWWFFDDCMMIVWWFYNDFVMILWWFCADFMMILWWFYDDFMIVRWFYNDFIMILWWFYGHYKVIIGCLGIVWVSPGHHLEVIWRCFGATFDEKYKVDIKISPAQNCALIIFFWSRGPAWAWGGGGGGEVQAASRAWGRFQ